MTSINRTMFWLNSASFSAGIQYSRWSDPPTLCLVNCDRYSVFTANRVTYPEFDFEFFAFQSRAI